MRFVLRHDFLSPAPSLFMNASKLALSSGDSRATSCRISVTSGLTTAFCKVSKMIITRKRKRGRVCNIAIRALTLVER